MLTGDTARPGCLLSLKLLVITNSNYMQSIIFDLPPGEHSDSLHTEPSCTLRGSTRHWCAGVCVACTDMMAWQYWPAWTPTVTTTEAVTHTAPPSNINQLRPQLLTWHTSWTQYTYHIRMCLVYPSTALCSQGLRPELNLNLVSRLSLVGVWRRLRLESWAGLGA